MILAYYKDYQILSNVKFIREDIISTLNFRKSRPSAILSSSFIYAVKQLGTLNAEKEIESDKGMRSLTNSHIEN